METPLFIESRGYGMIDEGKGVCLETKVRGEAESQGRRPAI